MRVLFSSTFGYGHVFPMVPLARAFAAAGHEVLWATSAQACEHVAAAGVEAVPAGLTGAQLQQVIGPLHVAVAEVPPAERAAFMYPRMFGEALTPPMVVDLLAVAREFRPDLLVHEHGELASPLVGAVLGVPSVTHSYGGGIPSEFLSSAGEMLAPLWADHRQPLPPYAGCFTSTYLDICPPKVQTVPLDHVGERLMLRPVPYTGEQTAPLPPCVRDASRPLVYLTLGTVQNRAPVFSAAVSALAELPINVLVTVGPDGDPDALGPQPAHVTVERYVSQVDVLPHCAAVVSHAGSGTFLGALSAGLPQLCLPQAADQFRNATAAFKCGAGLTLRPDEASPETIAAAVQRLLAEDTFRAAAVGIAADIRAMPAPEDVVALLATQLP